MFGADRGGDSTKVLVLETEQVKNQEPYVIRDDEIAGLHRCLCWVEVDLVAFVWQQAGGAGGAAAIPPTSAGQSRRRRNRMSLAAVVAADQRRRSRRPHLQQQQQRRRRRFGDASPGVASGAVDNRRWSAAAFVGRAAAAAEEVDLVEAVRPLLHQGPTEEDQDRRDALPGRVAAGIRPVSIQDCSL